jgi:hypothetical protein
VTNKWDKREKAIRQMAEDGMTDSEIGEVYRASKGVISDVRKALGITRKQSTAATPTVRPAPEPLPGHTYTDENGLTVTSYPTMYAEGAGVQSVTAKPRR